MSIPQNGQDGPDAPDARHTDGMSLPDDATAPSTARRAVRDALDAWELPHLLDDCQLAVTELSTNALRHGRPPVGLKLSRGDEQVRMDVTDTDSTPLPGHQGRQVSTDAESGRGLDIVRAISDDFGSDHPTEADGGGKSVHASWDVPPAL